MQLTTIDFLRIGIPLGHFSKGKNVPDDTLQLSDAFMDLFLNSTLNLPQLKRGFGQH